MTLKQAWQTAASATSPKHPTDNRHTTTSIRHEIPGRELSGKIKYGYCYGKTYREAKEKAAKRKAALANGAPLPTARTQKPFSSYCLEWLHTKKCTVKESTYIKYSAAVNKHIIPKLGVCHPLGFTTELMDDFIKELQFEDELAPKTVHDILVVLHGILKFASSKFAGSFPAVEININEKN